MDKLQELVRQIFRTLSEDDTETFNLLLEGSSEQDLIIIEKQIRKMGLGDKWKSFLAGLKQFQATSKQKRQDEDNVNKIRSEKNIQESSSESDAVEKQLCKKRQLKLQQKEGYPFYGNIKCLMSVYGDIYPQEASIKTMHSQIALLFQIFFRYISNLETTEGSLKGAIQKVWSQQNESFNRISKQYKKATKSTKRKGLDYEDSSNDQFIGEQRSNFFQGVDENSVQESQFFANLTKDMDEKQYELYSERRSVNFMPSYQGRRNICEISTFIKFLNPEKKVLTASTKFLDLLSFICCRVIKKIILGVNRFRNCGHLRPLSASITEEEIKKVGNQLVQYYENRFKLYKESLTCAENPAKKQFLEDFNNTNFKMFLPKIYQSTTQTGDQVWESNQYFRSMWNKRCQGQRQFEFWQASSMQDDYQFVTDYGKFLAKNIQCYKIKGSNYIWQKYFTQQKITNREQQNKLDIKSTKRKRRNLESFQKVGEQK